MKFYHAFMLTSEPATETQIMTANTWQVDQRWRTSLLVTWQETLTSSWLRTFSLYVPKCNGSVSQGRNSVLMTLPTNLLTNCLALTLKEDIMHFMLSGNKVTIQMPSLDSQKVFHTYTSFNSTLGNSCHRKYRNSMEDYHQAHSFILLHNILLYGYTTYIFLSHYHNALPTHRMNFSHSTSIVNPLNTSIAHMK